MPAKHMGLSAGNKNHQLVGQVDSVNKDHMMNLVNQWRKLAMMPKWFDYAVYEVRPPGT